MRKLLTAYNEKYRLKEDEIKTIKYKIKICNFVGIIFPGVIALMLIALNHCNFDSYINDHVIFYPPLDHAVEITV